MNRSVEVSKLEVYELSLVVHAEQYYGKNAQYIGCPTKDPGHLRDIGEDSGSRLKKLNGFKGDNGADCDREVLQLKLGCLDRGEIPIGAKMGENVPGVVKRLGSKQNPC